LTGIFHEAACQPEKYKRFLRNQRLPIDYHKIIMIYYCWGTTMDTNKADCFDRMELLRATKKRVAELRPKPVSPIVIPHERPLRFAKGMVTIPSVPKPAPQSLPVSVDTPLTSRGLPPPLNIRWDANQPADPQ
jgi:hypothetical protein